jgi:hypothetical protein
MKRQLLAFSIVLLANGLWSCKERDNCTSTRTSFQNVPVIHPFSEIRDSIQFLPGREMQDPGKICFKDNFLFVSEIKKGVHIIDNSNPANPVFLSFIQIPGNGDIIIHENRLYADSYSDLISFDITDLNNIKEVERAKEIFEFGWFNGKWWNSQDGGLFYGEYTQKYVTDTITFNCNEPPEPEPIVDIEEGPVNSSYLEHAKTPPRFAVKDKYLYSSGINFLNIFDLDESKNLKSIGFLALDQAHFSFSLQQDKLFVGMAFDLAIYDIESPLETRQTSRFDSVTSCDKIAVHDNIAYITERTGTLCGGNQNRLKLIDISNTSIPRFIKAFPLDGPRALSIDFPILYVCEGVNGFKVFDVLDTATIDQHLLSYEKDIQANNIAVSGKTVFITSIDGLYQLDATDPRNLHRLSKIPFKKI